MDNFNRQRLLLETISLLEDLNNQPTVSDPTSAVDPSSKAAPIELTVSLAWLQKASMAEIAALTRRD